VGPCTVENRPEGGLPDSDNDTIPDGADDCPGDPNSGQEDGDLAPPTLETWANDPEDVRRSSRLLEGDALDRASS
jgi:hypothetical protein